MRTRLIWTVFHSIVDQIMKHRQLVTGTNNGELVVDRSILICRRGARKQRMLTSAINSPILTFPSGRMCSLASTLKATGDVDQTGHPFRLAIHDVEKPITRGLVVTRGAPQSSINPTSEESGERSSWLTLATKSARICSAFRMAVISCMINIWRFQPFWLVMRLDVCVTPKGSHQRYPNLLLITAAEDFIDGIQDFRVADRERK